MSDTDADTNDETITYLLEVEKGTWRPWSNTVPRQTSLNTRLETLIEEDLKASRLDGTEDVSTKTVSVMATRLRIRARSAIGSIRDDDKPEEAIDQLEDIIKIADALEM